MKVKYIALLPVLVLAAVLAIPVFFGNTPISLHSSAAAHPAARAAARSVPAASSTRASTRPAPTASPDPYAVQTVAHPWTAGQTQTGIQVYWSLSQTDTVADLWGKARRAVDYAVSLDANSVCITFPFSTPGRYASTVGAYADTPSPADIGIFLQEAAKAKLRVTVRPLLDESTLGPPTGWRGNIVPGSLTDWFASYQSFLDPYAAVAQQYGAATFVVGTELNSLEGDPRWPGLIAQVGTIFHGQVGYDANYDDFLADPTIKVPAAQLGVDAYFHVDVPDDATAEQITQGWNDQLDQKTTGPLNDIIFSEVGIMDEDGAFDQPGDFYSTNAFNPDMQPVWYAGVCQVVKQRDVAGIYFWDITFDDNPAQPPLADQSPLDFASRPSSEAAIRTCFGSTLQ
jgi:hypothetical protein